MGSLCVPVPEWVGNLDELVLNGVCDLDEPGRDEYEVCAAPRLVLECMFLHKKLNSRKNEPGLKKCEVELRTLQQSMIHAILQAELKALSIEYNRSIKVGNVRRDGRIYSRSRGEVPTP